MDETIRVRRDELVRIYLVNVTEFDPIDSLHIHGLAIVAPIAGGRPTRTLHPVAVTGMAVMFTTGLLVSV